MEKIISYKSCSGARRIKEVVYSPEPHPQSLAALILIKNRYMLQDPEANPFISWQIYHQRKQEVLKEHFAKYGRYICYRCGRDDLSANVPKKSARFLTIDHIVPVSRGGSYTSKSNLAVCCNKCNNEKGDKLEVSL